MYSKLIDTFEKYYGTKAQYVVLSSGRVNLIGEHIDYHNGNVLPCAIALKNILVGSTSQDYIVRCYSVKGNNEISVNIQESAVFEKGSTAAYIYGVCRSIIDAGYFIKGFRFVIDGDLPIGAGLSSSASFCCGLIELISNVFRLNIDKRDIARIARRAENNYAGVPCGIMDQMAIVFGRQNRLVKIDCRDLSVDYCHMPDSISIVVVNTLIKRQLAKSEYAKRQAECTLLLDEIKRIDGSVTSLRDIDYDLLSAVRDRVDKKVYMRGKYVLDEMKRVERMFEAMNSNRIKDIGDILLEGHIGLRDEYEVSCEELNTIVDESYKFEHIIGSRMTGAGFGGCAIALVEKGFENDYSNFIIERYKARLNKECEVYMVGQPSDGLTSFKL
jgi:galactokinase